MKLGNGNIKYQIKFIYELTNKITYKFVYANSSEEALKLFEKAYSEVKDVRILSIKIYDAYYFRETKYGKFPI